MRAATSIWSRYVNRLFGTTRVRGRTALRRSVLRRRESPPVYAAAEVMEERALLSATFGAALSFGNDTGNSAAYDVATDQAGNSYMTGSFSGTVDFDQSGVHSGNTDILTARGTGDAFVAKYAPDNSLLWVQRMGGDASGSNGSITDAGRSIAVDGSGNVYVSGGFIGSADFGSMTLTTAGDRDGFVVKLNAGGTVQWARDWGTTVDEQGYGVGVDAAGNVYALGRKASDNIDILKFSATGRAVWSKSLDVNLSVSADLAVNGGGNVFVVGGFNGVVDFDPGPKTFYANGGSSYSAYVLKLDTNGKFGWVSPFVPVASTSAFSAAQSVALDGSGNVVVGGYYAHSVDFNPGSGTTTLPTVGGGFITKLNSSGALVWARALERADSNNTVFVDGLAVDSAGSIYAGGTFTATADFDPGTGTQARTSAGAGDSFALKLTASGDFSWVETFGGMGSDVATGIAVDPTGGIHLVGYFAETVDFDPDPLATYYLTNPGTFRNGFRLRLRQV